jgi:hypothetical protein
MIPVGNHYGRRLYQICGAPFMPRTGLLSHLSSDAQRKAFQTVRRSKPAGPVNEQTTPALAACGLRPLGEGPCNSLAVPSVRRAVRFLMKASYELCRTKENMKLIATTKSAVRHRP